MVGPSGFVERYKGKVTMDQGSATVAGFPLYGKGSVTTFSSTPGAGISTGFAIPAYGISLVASSANNSFVIQPPQYIGEFKTIQTSTVGGTVVFMASTNGSITFNGSSFSVVKSTVGNSVYELLATSSVNWALTVQTNSSVTHTLSTSS